MMILTLKLCGVSLGTPASKVQVSTAFPLSDLMRINRLQKAVVASQKGAAWLPAETEVNNTSRRTIEREFPELVSIYQIVLILSGQRALGQEELCSSKVTLIYCAQLWLYK